MSFISNGNSPALSLSRVPCGVLLVGTRNL